MIAYIIVAYILFFPEAPAGGDSQALQTDFREEEVNTFLINILPIKNNKLVCFDKSLCQFVSIVNLKFQACKLPPC